MEDVTILCISMNTPNGKARRDSLDYPITWIEGSTYETSPDYLKKNWLVRWNQEITDKVTGFIGCFASHIKCWEHIVELQLDDVIVVEDDAHIDWKYIKKVDFSEFPQDSPCLLGGTLRSCKPWSKDREFQLGQNIKDINDFEHGINHIDYVKHRWTQTHAIFYPNWMVAQGLLDFVHKHEGKFKSPDLFFSDQQLVKYLHYPSLFDHNDMIDSNRQPLERSNSIITPNGQGVIRNYRMLGKNKETVKKYTEPFRWKTPTVVDFS
jgi:hypothetical protein